jgi:magnesium-protoporphyrin O-methyltransferase
MAEPAGPCCFDDWARDDARRARRRTRPDAVTRALVEALDRSGLRDRSVLDIGCGAGELTLACLDAGASRATGLDLGSGAIDHARALSTERGYAEVVTFAAMDATTAELAPHDVVVLSRVICCYPDATSLVDHTAAAAGSTYGFVVPRSSGVVGRLTRLLMRAENAVFRIRRRKFGGYRAFVHDVAAIDEQLGRAGMRQVHRQHLRLVWHLAVYQREA